MDPTRPHIMENPELPLSAPRTGGAYGQHSGLGCGDGRHDLGVPGQAMEPLAEIGIPLVKYSAAGPGKLQTSRKVAVQNGQSSHERKSLLRVPPLFGCFSRKREPQTGTPPFWLGPILLKKERPDTVITWLYATCASQVACMASAPVTWRAWPHACTTGFSSCAFAQT